jgi:hypothetical protein
MERKYSLNEVDDFISKYRNKKNLNINIILRKIIKI